MNMFKKNGGFTLVELIVVIAILAILAGIAIPAYSGYITKANAAGDSTQLSAIKTAVMAANAEKGTVVAISFVEGEGVTSVTLTGDVAGTTDGIDDYFGGEGVAKVDLKTGSKADWANNKWTISGEANKG